MEPECLIVDKTIENYSIDENEIENSHHHYSNSYSKVQHLFVKIWYGHGRTASDGLGQAGIGHIDTLKMRKV